MTLEKVYRNLSLEEKRDVLVGLYVRSVKGRRELLKGGLAEIAKAGRMVREGMNIAAALMAEEFGQLAAFKIGLERRLW